jgi:Family of unknown function (DUF6152)
MSLPNNSVHEFDETSSHDFALTEPNGGGIVAPTTRCSVKIKIFAFLALAVASISTPISAHHGASVYDSTKLTTMKGTVTDFQFMNPHTEILFDVPGANGKVEKWTGEAPSLTTMSRIGWNKTVFKPGDQVTFVGNLAKSGSHIMRLRKVVFPNGKETVMDRGEDYAE